MLGYDHEPYLRVGRRGVFENTRSPATYLNRSTTISGRPPASADASAAPVWRRISSGTTARWHDHRAHFMGSDDPPAVARNPDTRRVVDNFEIPMRVRRVILGRRHGQIVYVPPPSPWSSARSSSRRRCSWPRIALVAHGVRGRARDPHRHRARARDRPVGRRPCRPAKLAESLYSLADRRCSASAGCGRRASAVPLVLVATIFLFVAGWPTSRRSATHRCRARSPRRWRASW